MRKINYLICVLIFALFVSCVFDDENEIAMPTEFNGRVVYSNTSEPVDGIIVINGFSNEFPVRESIISKEQFTGEGGTFNIEFEADNRIDRFVIAVFENGASEEPLSFISTNCMDIDCTQIPPGKIYDNFLIELSVE